MKVDPGSVVQVEDARGNRVTVLTAAGFAHPPISDWPWVRYNFPPETAQIPDLERELQELYDAGVGGVEIGQGGAPTFEQLAAILRKATALGMSVSLKYKDGAPVPGTYAETDDYVRKMLQIRDTTLAAGQAFEGALPGEGTLVAVLAYRMADAVEADTRVIALDRASVVDLTSSVTATNTDGFLGGSTAGALAWIAPAEPAGARWVLITFRAVAYSPQPEVYSRKGTDQLIAGYEAYWPEEIKTLLQATSGGDLFVDSHDTDPWGAVLDLWSSNLAGDFQSRLGYDLIPNLAALIHPTMNRIIRGRASFSTDRYYAFSDGSAERIRADFNQLRSDLYIENRILPFKEWAAGYNLKLRLQFEDGVTPPEAAYNFGGDQIQVTYHLDRTEHETLAQVDAIDSYRPMASANHLSGSTWYSNELAAALGMNYVQTFQDLMIRMNKGFAGGNTKPVYHVYPHAASPTATWPGHDHFAPAGFSNSWGPRNPNWNADAKRLNAWMARNGQVLSQGVPRVDLAVYMHNFSYPTAQGDLRGHWNDPALYHAGYSWDYLNPTLLSLPGTTVRNGRLALDGPAYKALVFDADLWPPQNAASGDLTLAMADRFLEYAVDGLPILFVGRLPDETPGDTPEDDARLRERIERLMAFSTVRHVRTEADAPAALWELGVEPAALTAALPSEPSSLFSVRRHDAGTGTDYYFLYNQGHQSNTYNSLYEEPTAALDGTAGDRFVGTGDGIDLEVRFEGAGAPYRLDAGSGTITPLAEYEAGDGYVTLPIRLGRDESMLLAITRNPQRFGSAAAPVHVTGTTAERAVQTAGGDIAVQLTSAGRFETVLSNGETVSSQVEFVPEPLDLTAGLWQLSAEDWQPEHPFGATGQDGAATSRHPVQVDLLGLRPWPDIPELARASGVGTYTTRLDLPGMWADGYGAYLELGQVVDSFVLTVNGDPVPIDQINPVADIGPYLRAGVNEIVVRVATTLNNRLATLHQGVADRGIVQAYGLVGPVVLRPYKQERAWGSASE
ncbi:MAG: glycosyl hydrolase [Rhodothermales bacterium]